MKCKRIIIHNHTLLTDAEVLVACSQITLYTKNLTTARLIDWGENPRLTGKIVPNKASVRIDVYEVSPG